MTAARITLRQVAEKAQVHYATASTVLNGSKGSTRVSEETCRRVFQSAEELGYTVNRAAQQLRAQRSRVVGLLTGDLENPFFAHMVSLCSEALEREGYDVVLATRRRASAGDLHLLESLLSRDAVGVAVSASPAGPFTAAPDAMPLVSDSDMGGAIGPTTFTAQDGSHYLIWKNDGNSRGQDTWLWVQKLSADGLRVTGAPAKLIKEDQPWEGSLVEAPTLFQHGSKYYLFYSANAYNTCHYAVADAVTGPYLKPRSTPWLAETPDVCGPGGEDIVTARDGSAWMAYHTWAKGPNSYRSMSLDKLTWSGDVPVLNGPTHAPTPAP